MPEHICTFVCIYWLFFSWGISSSIMSLFISSWAPFKIITHLVVDSTLSDFHIYHYFQLIILFKNFICLMMFDFYSMYPAICTFHSSIFKQNLRKLHCPCISTKVVLIYALDKMFSRKVLFSHKSNHCYNIFS